MSTENLSGENLQRVFKTRIAEALKTKLNIKNVMAVPRLSKIVVNIGVPNAVADKKNVEKAAEILAQITGQKPKVTKAKKSIASFKLREGEKIGVVVTLRGKRMYDFFKKMISVVLPRIRDFRGVSVKKFDGAGNYSLGFSEYTVFPEIDPGKIERVHGLEVSIVTTAKDNKEGEELLRLLGMPFQKSV